MRIVDVAAWNGRLEGRTARDILLWAASEYGPDVAASSSFQTQSLPLLHMISEVAPSMPVLFLDTGYHFAETLTFRDQVVELLDLNLVVVRAAREPGFARPSRDGELYRSDPDLCCHLNKVEPMELALRRFRAWITGIRREQTDSRRRIRTVEKTESGIVRIHPMASWRDVDVAEYVEAHTLPAHPLHARGYRSVGCAPCTRPVAIGQDDRDGRWQGSEKTECGLHTSLRDREDSR